MNENFYYYWINLADRSDRRQRMVDQFSKLGITQHIRIDGVRYETSSFYRGCLESHLRAVYTAYKDKVDLAIFLEDDIVLTQQGLERINACLKALPNDWEVFQGHTINPNLFTALLQSIQKKENPINPIPNRIIHNYFMSCACYVMNRRGIERYIRTFFNFEDEEETKFTFRITDMDQPSALCEYLTYRFLNAYTSLYSCLNTEETSSSEHSHVECFKKERNINYRNMLLLQELEDCKGGLCQFRPLHEGIIHLDSSERHWFDTIECAQTFLKNV
jgi:GR25 family glycosyltransferase involved in LPS biosynthesis